MTDREKVIRGWERCRKCHDAPMLFSESYRDCEYTRGMYCRQDILIEDTLTLLKEQEAKIGHWIDTTKVIGFPRVECSVCGSGQGAIWMDYCPICGAKMEGR